MMTFTKNRQYLITWVFVRWWMWTYLALSVDANVQRVSLTLGAIYDCRGALCVEVIALCQAVQRTGLNTTWLHRIYTEPAVIHSLVYTQETDKPPLTEQLRAKWHQYLNKKYKPTTISVVPARGSLCKLLIIIIMWIQTPSRLTSL